MHRRNSAETVTLWEFLPDDFIYPKYDNLEISIHDPCKVRRGRVYDSVRKLLEKMNIIVKEPLRTREKSPCCEYFGSAENMEKRVSELPLKDAAVYCTGCFAGISKGGGNPIHLIDLLFGGKYGR
jgi:Fe-S oxidoreductase